MKYKKLYFDFIEKFDELALYIRRQRSDLQPTFFGKLRKFLSELEELKKEKEK